MRGTERQVTPATNGAVEGAASVVPHATDTGRRARAEAGAIDLIISWLLRIGVWTSITIIIAGIVWLVISDHDALLHGHAGGLPALLNSRLSGQPVRLNSYGGVLSAVSHGQAYGVIMLGLLVLLFTPVLRVAVSVVAFLVEHDLQYAVISAVVLALLITGMVLGKAGG